MTFDLRLSRLLAFVLRHQPEEFGLSLDAEGFVLLDSLIDAVRKRPDFSGVTREDVEAVVRENPKPRFEIREDLIRARYGHSINGHISYPAMEPPAVLYHGTGRPAVEAIRRDGLRPRQRQYLHLSVSREDAYHVGKQSDVHPVVLEIQAREAHREGIAFFRAAEEIWLCERIPPQYFRFPPGS